MDGIGTTIWKWEVDLCVEQEPGVEFGAETKSNARSSCCGANFYRTKADIGFIYSVIPIHK